MLPRLSSPPKINLADSAGARGQHQGQVRESLPCPVCPNNQLLLSPSSKLPPSAVLRALFCPDILFLSRHPCMPVALLPPPSSLPAVAWSPLADYALNLSASVHNHRRNPLLGCFRWPFDTKYEYCRIHTTFNPPRILRPRRCWPARLSTTQTHENKLHAISESAAGCPSATT